MHCMDDKTGFVFRKKSKAFFSQIVEFSFFLRNTWKIVADIFFTLKNKKI